MPASMEAFTKKQAEQEETDKSPCKLLFTEEPCGIPEDLHDKFKYF